MTPINQFLEIIIDLYLIPIYPESDIDKERKLENLRKDFVAGVSHELKTPIGIIEGYAEGIRDGIVSGKDLDLYIETIIDEKGISIENWIGLWHKYFS